MRIILAQPRGFCAGVVRAIDIVELALASLSSRVRNTGAMTTAQLRRRFRRGVVLQRRHASAVAEHRAWPQGCSRREG